MANRGFFGEFDPFGDFDRLRRDMDELFGVRPSSSGIRSVVAGTFPPINIGVSPQQVDVYAFAAGLDPKTLDVSVQQNLLTLTGERKADHPVGAQFYRQERFNGSFRRVIALPDDVDSEKVTARYRDGVVHISVPRREAVRPRQIQVK